MTDDDKVKAVVTVLTGEFFVGQHVRTDCEQSAFHNLFGVIQEIDATSRIYAIGINLGEKSDGETVWFNAANVRVA